MDIGNILAWIVNKSISGAYLNIIDVPEEGDEDYEQNEEWWMQTLGACPPRSIPSGKYLCFYADCYYDFDYPEEQPDSEIENGDDKIYLYKIE